MRSRTKQSTGSPWIALAIFVSLACVSVQGYAAPGSSPSTAVKVDLNQATQAEFESLPGIGPALAARILEYREEYGPFQRVEDLMNVRGIGEKSFLKIRDRITVGDKKPRKG